LKPTTSGNSGGRDTELFQQESFMRLFLVEIYSYPNSNYFLIASPSEEEAIKIAKDKEEGEERSERAERLRDATYVCFAKEIIIPTEEKMLLEQFTVYVGI
jgi:hypothetical protein